MAEFVANEGTGASGDSLDWSAPIIEDVLRQQYTSRRRTMGRPNAEVFETLFRLHSRCWIMLLNGDETGALRARDDLDKLLAGANLETDIAGCADAAVLAELTDVVVKRFRRSTYEKTSYCERLLAAGQRFARPRPERIAG